MENIEIISNIKKNSNFEILEVKLTPLKYLNNDLARYLRLRLINNEFNSDELKLEILHDKFNKYDPFALEVYLNKTMIGFIQKYNNPININKFCFKNGKLINSLKLKWSNDKFILIKKVPIKEINLTKKEVIKIITKEIKKDKFFKKRKNIWASWNEIYEDIIELIDENELYTKRDYKKFVKKSVPLYLEKIKNMTKLIEKAFD